MHERANGEVREQKAPRFLLHEVGRLAAQDAPRAALVRFECVERGFDFPTLVIHRGHLGGGRAHRLQDRGDEVTR